MKLFKLLIISFLSVGLTPKVLTLSSPPCQLEVETQVTKPSPGKSDGEITFRIESTSESGRYKIFLLNKGSEIAREELRNMKVSGLKKDFYDFIIIDTKGDKCFKEITIILKKINFILFE